MATKHILSLRVSDETKAWLSLRTRLTGRSFNAEILSLLDIFHCNDDCTELEVIRERGFYILKSKNTGERFGAYLNKGAAIAAAEQALAVIGFGSESIFDETSEAA